MYQEYKIKNYYLVQQNYFLKRELTLKQNTIDKLLEISSSQRKERVKSLKREVRKPSILEEKLPVANSNFQTSLLRTAVLLNISVIITVG